MQAVRLPPQVPVLLPVRQLDPDRVPALLLDHLGDEPRTRHVHQLERTEPGPPYGAVPPLLEALGETEESGWWNTHTL